MTILLIHNYYQQKGGEDTVFEIEVEALKQAGHRVITLTRHNKDLDSYSIWRKLAFPFTVFKNRAVLYDLDRLLACHTVDVAHVHNVFPLITPYIYKYLHKKKIRIVQTLHNYRFLCPNGLLILRRKRQQLCRGGRFFSCIFHRCYKKSFTFSLLYALLVSCYQKTFKSSIDAYITLTEYSKKIFLAQGYAGDKLFTKDNASPSYKRSLFQHKKNYFLYLGRLSEEKGIFFLLKTFKHLPDHRLLVAGTGDNYQELVETFSSSNIEFIGFISGAEKEKFLSEATALIIPSLLAENYPVSLVEAFNCGTPVIGSNIGGIPDIIREGCDGLLFETGNQDSLVEKVQLLAGDEEMVKRMARNAERTFHERMEIATNIKKLETIYRKVAG